MKLRRKALWPVLLAMAVVLGWFLFYPGNDLTYQGQRLSVWFNQMFRARTQEERKQARDAFNAMGEHAIPFLVDRLKAQDTPWREKYRRFYFTHSSRWPRWIAARFPVPSAENAEFVRANAAWLLGSLGERAKPAVPALARALADESPSVRSSATQALRGLATAASEAIPAVAALLGVSDSYIADNAGGVLVSIGKGTPEVTSLLVPMLTAEDTVKIRVLRILSKLGDASRPAESNIEKLLTSPNTSVRFAAVATLWDVFPSRHIELLPRFEEFADRTDVELREASPYGYPQQQPPGADLREAIGLRIARMHPLTERGAELLGSLLKEGSDDFYWRVLTVLGQRGRESPATVPVVAKALEHDNPRVVAKAAEVLGQIADSQPSVVPALETATRHPHKMVRDAAEKSLQKIAVNKK